ncbi:esterase-like activity of phytase family protein [Chitinimonas sp.]|uniref:esterase-like activity of phytase family protein n=1 Tax=Chitinimonas sp. TaxID=1934313 RepID=UPI002F949953
MRPARFRLLALSLTSLLLAACATTPAPLSCKAPATPLAPASIGRLALVAQATLPRQPNNLMLDYGGISAIDYEPQSGHWYLISDDRSSRAPARFYEADIRYGAQGFSSLQVLRVQPFRQPDGSYYPPKSVAGEVPDPESLRIDPCQGGLIWSSEGDRKLGLDPFIRRSTLDGRYTGSIALPQNLRMHPKEMRGPRDNLTLEGLAFTQGGRELWASVEAPLYEDGPLPDLTQGAYTRFNRIDLASGKVRQYAYPLDAIPLPGSYGEKRADQGVSEILAIDDTHLLVIERSGREVGDGAFDFDIRLYEATLGQASDVAGLASLQGTAFVPMQKRLLLHLNEAGLGHVDNIEGAAWGPPLPDGRAALVLVADDNFAANQLNQMILLAVEPGKP